MTEFTFRRLVVGLLGLNTFLLFAFAGAAFVFFKVEPPPLSTNCRWPGSN